MHFSDGWKVKSLRDWSRMTAGIKASFFFLFVFFPVGQNSSVTVGWRDKQLTGAPQTAKTPSNWLPECDLLKPQSSFQLGKISQRDGAVALRSESQDQMGGRQSKNNGGLLTCVGARGSSHRVDVLQPCCDHPPCVFITVLPFLTQLMWFRWVVSLLHSQLVAWQSYFGDSHCSFKQTSDPLFLFTPILIASAS